MIKKLILLIIYIVLSTTITLAQVPKSQRLVLCEEFTQMGSGACAAYNPKYDSLLQANAGKVISINYQVPAPGYDLLYFQNPTDVDSRAMYYNVPSVPYSIEDGTAYKGNLAGMTQAKINSEYLTASPFAISLSHQYSTNMDSVFIRCIIKSTVNYTYTGPLKAYIAMIEDSINFATAPGTNGEKVFYNVMRKMYPDASGKTLA